MARSWSAEHQIHMCNFLRSGIVPEELSTHAMYEQTEELLKTSLFCCCLPGHPLRVSDEFIRFHCTEDCTQADAACT